jgi:ABC-2 type transport system ATP-binding protein
MSNPIVSTTSLSKTFRDFWCRKKVTAVSDLDLSIQKGEIFGLLGPNGSGKSTTLKLLLGLLHPTHGSVSIFGSSPRKAAARRRLGYLPEDSQLYQQLTAAETLHFYGGLFGLKGTVLHERTEQLLDMVGLTHAADRSVGEFSRGMTRRIGLAQALINDPDLLILDEPTAGLDPVGCRQTKDLLQALAKRGKTILLCSHLMADVEDVCSRIMLLHNGRSLAVGAISELLQQPNQIRFSLEAPDKAQIDAVKTAIQDICGISPEIDTATIPLETFFINTVTQAAAQNNNIPSGVSQATELAPFLKNI